MYSEHRNSMSIFKKKKKGWESRFITKCDTSARTFVTHGLSPGLQQEASNKSSKLV